MDLFFRIQIGRLEARSCNKRLLQDGEHTTIEIVKWADKEYHSCIVIAYWKKNNEGYDLKFVGDRPFDIEVSPFDFFSLARIAQKYLDEAFENEADNT